MKSVSRLLIACFALFSLALASPSRAEAEKRIAFVVGNAAYQAAPLATPANDAGLIAQTLQAAGFDVAGARDLDGEALRGALRDFLDKAQASGPDTVAFVYLSGYGVQLDGDNYFVPVDAKIAAAQDVAIEALRISDYTKRLAGFPLKASFIVLDAARASPFAKSGQPLAGGLALVDPEPDMLVAFNAAPGTVAPAESGSYGAYARALAEMIREGGLSPSDVFDGVRLRVNEETKGAEVPWDASRISAPFVFFERAADAPPPALAQDRVNAMRSRPLRDLGAQDAYAAAIERDTLQGYEEFLAAYPSDPLANRIRGLVAARREAMTWRRTRVVNTPDAYWSYLDRYPRGPHAVDARRRLASLTEPEEPPPSFSPIGYDIPPPPPAEIVYVDRPLLVFDDPEFGFVPPPPIVFLAPPPPYLVFLPPPPPFELFVLPVPVFVPFPVWINSPAYVVAPPGNAIFKNIHNTTIINNKGPVINPGSPNPYPASGLPTAAGVGAGVAAAAIAAKVALPPSVAKKATIIGGSNSGLPEKTPASSRQGRPPASREHCRKPVCRPVTRCPARTASCCRDRAKSRWGQPSKSSNRRCRARFKIRRAHHRRTNRPQSMPCQAVSTFPHCLAAMSRQEAPSLARRASRCRGRAKRRSRRPSKSPNRQRRAHRLRTNRPQSMPCQAASSFPPRLAGTSPLEAPSLAGSRRLERFRFRDGNRRTNRPLASFPRKMDAPHQGRTANPQLPGLVPPLCRNHNSRTSRSRPINRRARRRNRPISRRARRRSSRSQLAVCPACRPATNVLVSRI